MENIKSCYFVVTSREFMNLFLKVCGGEALLGMCSRKLRLLCNNKFKCESLKSA